MTEEVYNKKIKRIFSNQLIDAKYNYYNKLDLNEELKRNIQQSIVFKITEYSTLIFQNLRLRSKISQETFR